MKLKHVITFLYLVVSIPLFLFLKIEPLVLISFFINFIALTYIINYHLNIEKVFSPFLTSYIIFTYLFFIMAPMIQISSIESTTQMIFPNSYPYIRSNIIYTNFLILLFNIVFFVTYIYIKRKNLNIEIKDSIKRTDYSTPLLILVLFCFSLMILVFNFRYLLHELSSSVYSKLEASIAVVLIKKKVLFFVPLGALIISYHYLKIKNKLTVNTLISFLILLVLVLLLLLFKNPLTEKRNALGPIYITLIYIFYPRLINNNAKFFLFLFLSMIVVFPLVSSITHLNSSLYDIINKPNIVIDELIKSGHLLNNFNTLHYDAFPNIMATLDYIELNGLSWGYQFLGSILFFFPRNVWVSKPLTTGKEIGNYLIEHHNFGDGNFNNLSNSLLSEGYLNFGIVGVLLASIILAVIIVKLLNWLRSQDPLKEGIAFYFAVHLMFLLRGDLTNGIAYFIGPLVGVYLIPKLINKLLRR